QVGGAAPEVRVARVAILPHPPQEGVHRHWPEDAKEEGKTKRLPGSELDRVQRGVAAQQDPTPPAVGIPHGCTAHRGAYPSPTHGHLESVEPHTVLIGFQPRTQAEMAPPGERRLAHTDPAGLVVERKRAGPLRLELPPPGRDPSLPPANASGGAPRQ